MNYLAHLELSFHDTDVMIGNFLVDLLNKSKVDGLPEKYQLGVELHKQIDSFTDNHFLVRCFVQDLIPTFGKLSPVIADIFFDYALAHNWNTHTKTNFSTFQKNVYQQLEDNLWDMPIEVRDKVSNWVKHKWLGHYSDLNAMKMVFERLNKRIAGFESSLLTAHVYLYDNQENVFNVFNEFYPDLQNHAKKILVESI